MSERQVVAMLMGAPHRSERAEQARSDLAGALPGADDHIVFAEPPSLLEHWRARG